MRPTILLFDVDGTLIVPSGLGRRALERVFVARFGRSDGLDDVRFDGMTDRGIVRAALAAMGPAAAGVDPEATIDALLAAYVPLLRAEIADVGRVALHRGVDAVLDAVGRWTGVAVGLGTGNVRPGAQAKLEAAGVWERFAFGGFGCDAEERATLLRIGAERGAARLGAPVADCRVVVIGDTPRDVAAARAMGADSVAVGTSRYPVDALVAAGATATFPDLTADGVLAALRGGA